MFYFHCRFLLFIAFLLFIIMLFYLQFFILCKIFFIIFIICFHMLILYLLINVYTTLDIDSMEKKIPQIKLVSRKFFSFILIILKYVTNDKWKCINEAFENFKKAKMNIILSISKNNSKATPMLKNKKRILISFFY